MNAEGSSIGLEANTAEAKAGDIKLCERCDARDRCNREIGADYRVMRALTASIACVHGQMRFTFKGLHLPDYST